MAQVNYSMPVVATPAAKSQRSNGDIAHGVIAEQEFLQSNRGNFEQQWEEVAERMLPSYVGSFQGRGGLVTQGERNMSKIFDSTAMTALPKFVAACEAYLTPRNSTWHGLVAQDSVLRRNRSVQLWFEALGEALFKYRYATYSGFASQNQEVFTSMGAFGTGSMFVDKLNDPIFGRGIRYRSIHLAEIYFVENHQGIIYKAYRRFQLTAEQAYAKWGKACPEKILKDALNQGSPGRAQTQYTFVQCVRPRSENDGYDPRRLDVRRMPFAEYTVSVEEKKLLSEGGYNRFPFPVSRYITAPNETYGRGPGMLCLPTIKVLNEQGKIILKQGHRIGDPVILTHDDGVGNGFNLRPGSENTGYVNAQGQPLAHVLPTGNLAITRELINDNRFIVNDFFLVNVFQMLAENPQMTATEVLQRVQEKGQMLSPTMGRQQSEYLAPMIDREIDVLLEMDLAPEPPAILLDASIEYDVRYDSPLSRAQRAESAAGFMRTVQWAAEWFKVTGDPRVFDWVNIDEAMPAIFEINGAPSSWMNTLNDVKQERARRAEQQQIAQMIEAAPAVAGVAKAMPGAIPGASA